KRLVQSAERRFSLVKRLMQSAERRFSLAKRLVQSAERRFSLVKRLMQSAELLCGLSERLFQLSKRLYQSSKRRFQLAERRFALAKRLSSSKSRLRAWKVDVSRDRGERRRPRFGPSTFLIGKVAIWFRQERRILRSMGAAVPPGRAANRRRPLPEPRRTRCGYLPQRRQKGRQEQQG